MTLRPSFPTPLPEKIFQPAPARTTAERPRTYSIGVIATEFGVTLRALRFYEAKGMLKPRRRGRTRFYTLGDRERLATILKGKELGFSLRDIREMLCHSTGISPEAPLPLSALAISDQIATLESRKAAIDYALAGLRTYAAGLHLKPRQDVRSLSDRVSVAFEGGRHDRI